MFKKPTAFHKVVQRQIACCASQYYLIRSLEAVCKTLCLSALNVDIEN